MIDPTYEAVLSLVRELPEGFVTRNRNGLNPCVVLRFTGFMTAVTFAEGATWEEVHERLQLDPRVPALVKAARERQLEDVRRLEAARNRNTTRRYARR